jgi:hypothetical protein
MRKIEYVQSAYGGGFPADNGNFEHGEPLWLLSKLEYRAMLLKIKLLADTEHPEVAVERISRIVNEELEELNGTTKGK